MDVSKGEADLDKPIKNLPLRKMNFGLFGSFDSMSQVSSGCVLHNYVQFHLGSSVDFPEANDVGVIEHLKNLGLL